MGIADRMKKMNAAILADKVVEPPVPKPAKEPKSANTAPGGMMVFRQQLQKHETTVKALEDQLLQFKDGVRTTKLDTALVDESKWANRHASSFQSANFDALKDEIAHAGGNIQPILVRSSPDSAGRFEIVFGHRRFAACKQLNIPVLAMITEMGDEELFTLMDRENRQRQNLTPFEQGEMWRRALDDGLFSSARQLATHLGVSHVLVGQCVAIAKLPKKILDCFAVPTEIQLRWAQTLNHQLQSDPEALYERVASVSKLSASLPSAKVFDMLTSVGSSKTDVASYPLKRNGKVVGKLNRTSDGSIALSLVAGVVSDADFVKLQKSVESLISK